MVKKNCHVSGVQQSARGLAWRQLKIGLAACGAMQKQRKNGQHMVVTARAPILETCSSPHVVWSEVGTQSAYEQRSAKYENTWKWENAANAAS
jgi:hypothetical protein